MSKRLLHLARTLSARTITSTANTRMAGTTTGLQYQAIKLGGPFQLTSAPKTTPAAGEVLIKLRAVALNPVDWKLLYVPGMISKWPAVLGSEGAGIVEATGSDVPATDFQAGDEVLASLNP